MDKAAILFLVLIISQTVIAEGGTGQGAIPLDSARFPVTFSFELPPGINTSEQTDRYMEERTLIVIGDRIDLSERMMVEGTKAQRAWIVAELRAALKPATTATVIDRAARTPRLVLAPVPAVRHD